MTLENSPTTFQTPPIPHVPATPNAFDPAATSQDLARRFEEAARLSRLSPEGRRVYEQLWRARRQLASLEAVPAYHILTNRMILALAETPPVTLTELAKTPGFGRVRLCKYGEAIVKLLAPNAS
jgi:ribonuclease D